MTNESTITIGLVIAVVGCLIGIWNFFNTYKNRVKTDDDILNSIKEATLKANMKLDQQCGQLTDLQSDIKSTKNDVERMRETQIRHDMEIKALWKRLEGLDE